MRLRNLKNKEEIIEKSDYIVNDIYSNCGNWSSVFNNNNPICLEIGMGFGKFISSLAISNNNINYIGLEKLDNVMARAIKKIGDKKISNLKLIRDNALNIDKIFDGEIDVLYLNFSDPWPKKRQENRRLTSFDFLEKYDKIFYEDAKIIMKTDNYNLFVYSLKSLSKYGYYFEELSFDLHNDEDIDELLKNPTTEYEDKFIEKNRQIYYVVAIKKKKIIQNEYNLL